MVVNGVKPRIGKILVENFMEIVVTITEVKEVISGQMPEMTIVGITITTGIDSAIIVVIIMEVNLERKKNASGENIHLHREE